MFVYSIQKFQSPVSDFKFMLSVQQGAPFFILNSQKIMMTGIALHIDEWHRINWHTNLRNISIQSQTTQSKCLASHYTRLFSSMDKHKYLLDKCKLNVIARS